LRRQKAAEIVGYSRRRAKAIGCMLWPIMLVIGVIGWYLWKWYAMLLALIAAAVFGSLYSMIETKRIQRKTGLNIDDQEIAYRKSLASGLHPITRDPSTYREYIDSMPDEESEEEGDDFGGSS